jgi:hypothetical protein
VDCVGGRTDLHFALASRFSCSEALVALDYSQSIRPYSHGEAPGVADGGFSVTDRHDRESKRGNGFGQHDGARCRDGPARRLVRIHRAVLRGDTATGDPFDSGGPWVKRSRVQNPVSSTNIACQTSSTVDRRLATEGDVTGRPRCSDRVRRQPPAGWRRSPGPAGPGGCCGRSRWR